MTYFSDVSITYHEANVNDLMENKNYFIFHKIKKRIILLFIFAILLIILLIFGIEFIRRKKESFNSMSFQDILVNNTFPTTMLTSQSSTLSPKRNRTFNSSSICYSPSDPVYNKNGTTVAGITDQTGSDFQHFNDPVYVYLDSKNNIFIADNYNYQIVKYSSNNLQEGGTRVGDASFSIYLPRALYINHQNDDLYVLDFDSERRYQVRRLTIQASGYEATHILLGFQVDCFGMDIDDDLNIYISETDRHRVVKWFAPKYKQYEVVAGNGIAGLQLNQLNKPQGIYVDRINNDLYIADKDRIQLWPNGAMVGQTIVKNGLSYLRTIKRDCHGNLYVLQSNVVKFFNSSVLITDSEGVILLGIPTTDPKVQQSSTIDYFKFASDMYIDESNGDIYI